MIEKKYDLAVDRGMDTGAAKVEARANAKAQTIEAQSGQESLFSYVLRHKPGIAEKMVSATNWPEVHATFLQYGLSLVPAGNGLKIKDRYGKHHVKPSAIDRLWSKDNLEARFGGLEDRRWLAPGLKADLIRVKVVDRRPVVRSVWVSGRQIF